MPRSLKLPQALTMGFLALASFAVFAGPLQGAFVWDDSSLIANNAYLRQPDALQRAFTGDFWQVSSAWAKEQAGSRQMYRPIVSAAYVIEYRLWGVSSTGFHLVNLLLHVCCVLLAFRWLRRRLATVAGDSIVPAAIGALVFALHPSRAESVAWISGCTDLWMTLFILIGLEFWDRAAGGLGIVATIAAFALALLSKEVAVMGPVVLLVDAALQSDRGRPAMRRAGLVGAGLGAVLVGRLLLVPLSNSRGFIGGVGGLLTRTVATLGGFVRIALWPWPASTQTGYLASATIGADPVYPRASLIVGLITIGALFAFILMSVRRASMRPWLADAAWFFLFLLPVLNVIQLSATYYITERYLYAAGLGLAALAARVTAHLLQLSERARPLALMAALSLLTAFALGAAKHAGHFISADALWSYEHRRDPDNLIVTSNLMDTRIGQHRWDEAEALALDWMRLMPAPEDKGNAFGHWLSIELERAQETDDARLQQVQAEFEKIATGEELGEQPAEAIYVRVPEAGRAWLRKSQSFRVRRAVAALNAGKYPLARQLFEALARDPQTREGTRRGLVVALAAEGELDEADRRIDEAIQAHMVVDAPRLKALVQYLRGVKAQAGLAPEAEPIAVARAFTEIVSERAVARQLLLKAAEQYPGSADLLLARLNLDVLSERYADARAVIGRLRELRPGEAERWKAALEDLQNAEAATQLAAQAP